MGGLRKDLFEGIAVDAARALPVDSLVCAPHSWRSRMTRLPQLGKRGEGWVIGQFVLLGLVGVLSVPELGSLADPKTGARCVGLLLGALGLVLGFGLIGLGVRDLGRQVTPWPRPPADGQLVETGLYRSIRHPIYAGAMLVGIGWALLTGSVASTVAALGLAVWMDLKARREEVLLLARYPRYAAYRVRSWRFVPRIY
jgi:protein-S-isoprenylcysteine O-methyltransferase Ste14